MPSTGNLTIQAALDNVASQLGGSKTSAVIEITNNEFYVETPTVNLGASQSIQLRAKDGNRPVLVLSGDMSIVGYDQSAFSIDGLLIAGGAVFVPLNDSNGNLNLLDSLSISNCTLAPGAVPQILTVPAQGAAPRLFVEATDVSVTIDASILGAIRAIEESNLSISNSIVDATSEFEIAYSALDSESAGGTLSTANCTIIGKVHAVEIPLATNTIFAANISSVDSWPAPVIADELQQGCVRFSYVPTGSRVPRCFQCHPAADDPGPVVPAFTSLRFGDGAYCQLAQPSGKAILQGADNQSEIGVFNNVYQPQRIGNLETSLQDYIRFALNAGIFYAS